MNYFLTITVFVALLASLVSSFSIANLIKNANKVATAAIVSGVIGTSSTPALAEVVFQQPVKAVALKDVFGPTLVQLPVENNYVLNFNQYVKGYTGISTLFIPNGPVTQIPNKGTAKFSQEVSADEVDLAFGPTSVIYFKVPADFKTGKKQLTTFNLDYDGTAQTLVISKK